MFPGDAGDVRIVTDPVRSKWKPLDLYGIWHCCISLTQILPPMLPSASATKISWNLHRIRLISLKIILIQVAVASGRICQPDVTSYRSYGFVVIVASFIKSPMISKPLFGFQPHRICESSWLSRAMNELLYRRKVCYHRSTLPSSARCAAVGALLWHHGR